MTATNALAYLRVAIVMVEKGEWYKPGLKNPGRNVIKLFPSVIYEVS